jgi:hypothetical protein
MQYKYIKNKTKEDVMSKLNIRLGLLLLLCCGNVQAAIVDTITAFSSSDSYSAMSFTSFGITNLSGVENVQMVGTGSSSAFTHDYKFEGVSEDLVNIITITENTLLGLISSFQMSVFNITGAGMSLVGSTSILLNNPSNSTRGAFGSLAFSMVMDNDYLVRLAGSPAGSANYSLQLASIAPVPIPAAAWLFGTALIGLSGFGRRRKATIRN